MTVTIASIRSRVAADIANCPNPQIDRVLRDAARELCRVPIWQADVACEPFGTEGEHAMRAPDEAEIVAVQVEPMAGDESIAAWHMVNPRTISIPEPPNGPITIRVSLRPTVDAMSLPDILGSDWLDTIVAGALSRLYAMAHERWGNPAMAQYHGRRFRKGRNEAMAFANRGFTDRPQRVAARRFATFRSR